jgi:hypothetical protein
VLFTKCWTGLVCAAQLAAMVVLVGCVPIPVAQETATASARCEPMPEAWNAVVGPDVGLERVHALSTALGSKVSNVEMIPAERVWNALVPGGADRATAEVRELSHALRAASVPEFRDIVLVVMGPERTDSKPAPRMEEMTGAAMAAFYEVEVSRSQCEAVVLSPDPGQASAVRMIGEAKGEERSGWIPAGPLLFTRLYSTVDTLTPARAQLAERVAAEIATRAQGRPVRVVVIGAR